jgi:peroxin-3
LFGVCSPDFANVLSAALDCLLGDMQTELQLAFQGSPDDGIPLAKLLPHVAGVGNALLEFADDNKFVKSIAGLPTVQTFCAAVYSGEVTS